MILMPLPLHVHTDITHPLHALQRTFLLICSLVVLPFGCTISSPLRRPPFRLLLL
uniref:Uncharacterized protein n=1 Tax=Electrophorus electricus TaxID=8005 RepID=A0A4W4G7U6_ELEEL